MTHLVSIEPRRSLNETCLKLWIVDYFDEITNKIDIFTENVIVEKKKEYLLSNEQQNDLNSMRKNFLQIVDRLMLKNFSTYEENIKKIKQLLKSDEIRFIDLEQIEIAKSILFEKYCFLLYDNTIERIFKLKLITLDWYLNEYQQTILRLDL
jgi:hypothetical protein